MEMAQRPGSKRQIHNICFTRVGLLSQQIFIAQVVGILIIVGPSILLGSIFVQHAIVGIPVFIITVIYFLITRSNWSSTLDSITVLNRMRSWLGGLVFMDVFFILGLIGLSGGIMVSHLTFVLVLIPPILALVRGGGTTVVGICVLILFAVATDFYSTSLSFQQLGASQICSLLLAKGLYLQSGNAQQSPMYPIAMRLGILCGVTLALIQSYLAAGKTIPDDIFQRMLSRHQNGLEEPLQQKRLISSLARSYHKVSRIVSLTNHGDVHCSLVHPIQDLLFEAYVLALPAYRVRGAHGAQLMGVTVFAIHWLDDLFDGLGYHELLDEGRGLPPIDISKMSIKEVGRRFRPHGVERIVNLITCKSSPLQRLSFLKPSWQMGTEHGLMRVILAGVIQCSMLRSRRMEAIKRLRKDVQKLVDDEQLDAKIKKVSPVFLWGISKTDMPLVLGVFANPSDTKNLGSLSLLLDAALMPLLIWHDLDEEMKRESVGSHRFHTSNSLYEDIEAAVCEANSILLDKSQLLLQSDLWPVMKPCVEHVFSEFSGRLPSGKTYEDFKSLLQTFFEEEQRSV